MTKYHQYGTIEYNQSLDLLASTLSSNFGNSTDFALSILGNIDSQAGGDTILKSELSISKMKSSYDRIIGWNNQVTPFVDPVLGFVSAASEDIARSLKTSPSQHFGYIEYGTGKFVVNPQVQNYYSAKQLANSLGKVLVPLTVAMAEAQAIDSIANGQPMEAGKINVATGAAILAGLAVATLPITSSLALFAIGAAVATIAGYSASKAYELAFTDKTYDQIVQEVNSDINSILDGPGYLWDGLMQEYFPDALLDPAQTPIGENPSFPDLGSLLPSWLAPVGGLYGQAPLQVSSPLVLDLDGDGVEASKMGYGTGASTVYFDMDNDGFAERTAWATGGDGLLALDKNGNGKIDNQNELFGNNATYANGFLNLKQYDSNSDNKITSADAQWNNLRVWVDADNDGVTDAGELKTLSSLNITQISLSSTALTNTYLNENLVSDTSSFTINGVTRTISDVWFRNDTMDTRYQGDVTLDVRTLFLPTLKGFGNLKDLHVAMSQDTSLLTMVQNLVTTWNINKFSDSTALNNEIKTILYKWAGVDTVVDGSRGGFVNAKELSFLEILNGQPYGSIPASTSSQPQNAAQGSFVKQAFEMALDSLKSQLLAQTGAGTLFESSPVYNLATGELSSGILSLSSINDLKTLSLTIASSARDSFWNSVAEYILNVRDKAFLTSPEIDALNSAIISSGTGQTWESISTAVLSQYSLSYNVSELSDYIVGWQGNDSLSGNGGDDILNGGAGNDYLSGGIGNDTYLFKVGDGIDIIYDQAGTDTILMGAGITASNIRFEKPGNDLYIYYGTSDRITLQNHFYDDINSSNSIDEVETLRFADGSTINLKGGLTFAGTASNDSVAGTSMDDTVLGLAGNDYLYGHGGNDTLNGGAGNDYLSGGIGNDTYLFKVGDGLDAIYEESGTDTILMGAGITASNIRFEKPGNHLYIYYGTSDRITLQNHFYDDINSSNSIDEVETLRFADGSTINLKGGLTFAGTASNDSVAGTSMDDTVLGLAGNDYLYGHGGNDTLNGGAGNDYLSGGIGNDTYLFKVGDGLDAIYEESGTDTILMGAGITASNIRFEKPGNHLYIYYGTSDRITLQNHFYDDINSSNSIDEVETLRFADGSTINLKGGLTFAGTASNDSVAGTSMDDTVLGLAGNDYLYGHGGNDTLNGGTGDDYLYGDAGNDTATYINDTAGVTVNLSITTSQNTIGSGFDTLSGIENLIGSSFNDTLTGDANINSISGGNGNDIIDGGLGNDTLNGGLGNDTLNGNTGIDTASYAGTASAVTVSLAVTAAQNTIGAGTDTLIGIENLLGSIYNDILTGDANANLLDGGSGNDTLNGGLGNDTLIGNSGVDTISYAGTASAVTVSLAITTAQNTIGAGTDTILSSENLIGSSFNDTLTGDGNVNTIEGGLGNDILNGGAGLDTVSYASSTVGVTVNLSLTTAQNTIGAGTDTLSNFENIFASAFNDTLTGNSSANAINGGAGNDVIIGGLGADILTGGLGADTFRFLSTGLDATFDRVTDFSTAQGDKIDLKNLLVGYDAVTKAITDFVEFTTVGANTVVKVDRDGTGTTYGWQQVAQLDNVTGLTDEAALRTNGNLIVA
jgi:Ca2+-binding RTX toxin-like protein